MRILGVDPGAERCGWAIVEDGAHIHSGVFKTPRLNGEEFQVYRMRLTERVRFSCAAWVMPPLDAVVAEIVPSHGSEGFMRGGQGYLANVVATTVHNVALDAGRDVRQISASKWASKIAKRGRSKKITKAQIRNGVLERLPHLRKELANHLHEWDRWDAIGIALYSTLY